MEPTPSHPLQGDYGLALPGGVWRPLRERTFRNLLIANVFSDIGAFMQSVAAAWLMVSINAGPMFVALTQTASALPFFLFALPAGALGDIIDRRKLILTMEIWMATIAIVLAMVVITGFVSPRLLLGLTFALSAGDAVETPAWRAVLPELVAKEDLEAASALNGIEFNLARATGPGLAGLLISLCGISTAFIVNSVSFIGIIYVVARWKRPHRRQTAPPEGVTGATIAGLRYVRYSTAVRAVIIRAGVVMFFASALLALLPTLANHVSGGPIAFGLLLGCFGAGAVVGALILQYARARWSTEAVVSSGIAIVGLATVAAGMLRDLPILCVVMLIGGSGWIVFISLMSALVQKLVPDWVRARVSAVFILVFQGAVAAGSAGWGALGERVGVPMSLMFAGIGTLVSIGLGMFLRLPDTTVDVTPWNHWRMPVIPDGTELGLQSGPVLVTVEYTIDLENASNFLKAMNHFEQIRRRDGAFRWGIYRDMERPGVYLETYVVSSWAEHLRQHERSIRADNTLEERRDKYLIKESKVRHLIYAAPASIGSAK